MRQRQHWLALLLVSRAGILLWGFATIVLLLRRLAALDGAIGDTVDGIALVSLLAGCVILALRWWQWRSEEYLVTSRRLLNTSGIINKHSVDSSLEKINDAILEVNLVGRLLGYGDLEILTAAETAVIRYRTLNRATEFKKAMLYAKHALQSHRADGEDYYAPSSASHLPPAGSPIDVSGGAGHLSAGTPDEVAAELARLAMLRDAGKISPGEHELTKKELLRRL
jgi:hypothetical protein